MNAVITPENSFVHDALRDDVRQWVTSRLCAFSDFGVEHRTDKSALRILGRISDSTALHIRSAPDAWLACEHTAQNPNGIAIQLEFKSRKNHDNMALEAQPLANAIGRSRPPLNIKVLYCYRDAVIGQDAAFWCSNPPPFSRGFICPRDKGIHQYIRRVFPDVAFESRDDLNGSGDSCVIVNKDDWTKLPGWVQLLEESLFGFAA